MQITVIPLSTFFVITVFPKVLVKLQSMTMYPKVFYLKKVVHLFKKRNSFILKGNYLKNFHIRHYLYPPSTIPRLAYSWI